MIERPENLVIFKVHILFNDKHFDSFEIDLAHINSGKDGLRQNNVEGLRVGKIAQALIHNVILEPAGNKEFECFECTYFVSTGLFESKKFKIVFCVCSDKPRTIGIITLFRVRGKI